MRDRSERLPECSVDFCHLKDLARFMERRIIFSHLLQEALCHQFLAIKELLDQTNVGARACQRIHLNHSSNSSLMGTRMDYDGVFSSVKKSGLRLGLRFDHFVSLN